MADSASFPDSIPAPVTGEAGENRETLARPDLEIIALANKLGTGTQFHPPKGTASAPAYAIDGDLDTGIYSAGSNTLNVAVGGSQKLKLTAGAFTINAGSAYTWASTGFAAGDVNMKVSGAASTLTFFAVCPNATGGIGYAASAAIALT